MSATPTPVCSAKGCRTPASWVLAWNNPKLHAPDRRKTWAACDEHRDDLGGFLGARGFLRETLPVADWAVQPGPTPGQSPGPTPGPTL